MVRHGIPSRLIFFKVFSCFDLNFIYTYYVKFNPTGVSRNPRTLLIVIFLILSFPVAAFSDCRPVPWGKPILKGDVDNGYVTQAVNLINAGKIAEAKALDKTKFFNLTDPILILSYLYLGRPLDIPEAADTDDNGKVEMADAIALLHYLFLGKASPKLEVKMSGPANAMTFYTGVNKLGVLTDFVRSINVDGVERGQFSVLISDQAIPLSKYKRGEGVLTFWIYLHDPDAGSFDARDVDVQYSHVPVPITPATCFPEELRFSLKPKQTAIIIPAKFTRADDTLARTHYRVINPEPMSFHYAADGTPFMKRGKGPWQPMPVSGEGGGGAADEGGNAPSPDLGNPTSQTESQLDGGMSDPPTDDNVPEGDDNLGEESEICPAEESCPGDEEPAEGEEPPSCPCPEPADTYQCSLGQCILQTTLTGSEEKPSALSAGFNFDFPGMWDRATTCDFCDDNFDGVGETVANICAMPIHAPVTLVAGAVGVIAGAATEAGKGIWFCISYINPF